MSQTTKRRRIVEAYVTRLSVIRRANGFATDAGAAIYLGEVPELGPDDPVEAIAVLPEDDGGPGWHGEHAQIVWPIVIAGLAPASSAEAWLVAEAILGDIKRAVELEDRTLGSVPGRLGPVRPGIEKGPARVVPREAGSQTIGVGMTYLNRYTEQWGQP